MGCDEVAEAHSAEGDQLAPAFDALELGGLLDEGQRLDIGHG
jgi:hypothetical protein